MSDDLRIETDYYAVPNCPYFGIPNKARKIGAVGKTDATVGSSRSSETSDLKFKSVYNGDVHPGYDAEPCENCKKYAEWIGHDIDYNSLHSLPKYYTGLPLDIKNLYEEAIGIYDKDPARAIELLHKATRELSVYLG
jgi:hypothetical protein